MIKTRGGIFIINRVIPAFSSFLQQKTIMSIMLKCETILTQEKRTYLTHDLKRMLTVYEEVSDLLCGMSFHPTPNGLLI